MGDHQVKGLLVVVVKEEHGQKPNGHSLDTLFNSMDLHLHCNLQKGCKACSRGPINISLTTRSGPHWSLKINRKYNCTKNMSNQNCRLGTVLQLITQYPAVVPHSLLMPCCACKLAIMETNLKIHGLTIILGPRKICRLTTKSIIY